MKRLLSLLVAVLAAEVAFGVEPLITPGQPWLGVSRWVANQREVVLCGVLADGPAGKAGLRIDDSIVSIAGAPLRTLAEFHAAISRHRPGDAVSIEFERQNVRNTVQVTLAALPSDGGTGLMLAAAESGQSWAMMELGVRYAHMRGDISYAEKNPAEAVRWFRRAKNAGYTAAPYFLARMYLNGEGVPQDFGEARRLLEEARLVQGEGVRKGLYTAATNQLAVMHRKGQGVPLNPQEAARLFIDAAAHGSLAAMHHLGAMYEGGIGVTKSVQDATHWYRKANEHGYSEAQAALARLGDAPANHAASSAPQKDNSGRWGILTDPEGDAQVFVTSNGAIEMTVPGAYRDNWPSGGKVNAPRLLKPVRGDFSVQVKVGTHIATAGKQKVFDAPTKAVFRAATLLVWQDDQNFLRLERVSTTAQTTRDIWFYHSFVQGKRVIEKFLDVEPNRLCYLRIERKNGVCFAYYRPEGGEWQTIEAHHTSLPADLQVGLSLVNTASDPFTVVFEDYRINDVAVSATPEPRIATAPPTLPFALPAPGEMGQLQGTWVCVATLLDGKPTDTYVGVRAVISGDQLTWHFPRRDGTYIEQTARIRIDPNRNPKHFDWWPDEQPESVDRRLYRLAGDVMHMATNLDLTTRPATFESARWQFTIQRVPSH